jgi:hypothetical protein
MLQLQLRQLFCHIPPVRRRVDGSVNCENPAVRADVKRPPGREPARREHAVRPRNGLRRIAENRKVHAQRRREPRVRVGGIDARREILNVEPTQIVAARPERPAFCRSATGKCLRKPRENNGARAAEIAQPIRAAIRTRQLEVRRHIAWIEAHGLFPPSGRFSHIEKAGADCAR